MHSLEFCGLRMDLLALIGDVAKRREDLFRQAEGLARKFKTQENLEKRRSSDSEKLVESLRNKTLSWVEYERSLSEGSLISSLAAVYLGAKGNSPRAIMERAWPMIVGELLPPLNTFLQETKEYLDSGKLVLEEDVEDFADADGGKANIWQGDDIPLPPGESPITVGKVDSKKRPSWKGISSRASRYMASSTYSSSALGSHLVKVSQGFSYMRRFALHDDKTCADCARYAERGWQSLGSLPLPGKQCQCYDRCRCRVEYR